MTVEGFMPVLGEACKRGAPPRAPGRDMDAFASFQKAEVRYISAVAENNEDHRHSEKAKLGSR